MNDICMIRDDQFEKVMRWTRLIYALTGIVFAIVGFIQRDYYRLPLAILTFFIYPLMWAIYRIFHWQRANQLEFIVYLFVYIAFPLGSVADFFGLIPHYDKILHTLSGVFVSVIALAMYLYLERNRPMQEHNVVTAVLFVFLTSMAVAGLFEICEYTLAPIVGRDLQYVEATGVNDTMQDMIVCMVGTLAFLPFVVRFYRGKYDVLTGAVDAFIRKNAAAQGKTFAA